MNTINMTSINFDSEIFSNKINSSVMQNENKDTINNSETSFGDVLKDTINKVNDVQVNANEKIEGLIKGDDITMHDVMLSMQEAQISMQLMLEVRNKLYDAYKELSSVQL